jgi:ubiquinone/menaquinone biosynthesis C-methylase UbiE
VTVRQDKIREHYDTTADEYDAHYDCHRGRNYHSHISGRVMDALPRGGRLLDIGCGTGLFAAKYREDGGTAVGLDISRRMTQQARRRCPGGDFSVGTADKLPFRADSFDAISSLLAFTYLKHPEGMLSEAYRVLRPGGAIAICTLGKKLITSGIPALYHISEKIHVKHPVMKNFGEHYYGEREMRALFSDAGFEEIEITWCSFAHINMMDPLFNLARKVEPFVEKRVPQLAFNICVSGKKPENRDKK